MLLPAEECENKGDVKRRDSETRGGNGSHGQEDLEMVTDSRQVPEVERVRGECVGLEFQSHALFYHGSSILSSN